MKQKENLVLVDLILMIAVQEHTWWCKWKWNT